MHTHTHTHSPKTCHTASLEANPAQRQVVTDWQLPAQQLIPNICTPPVAAGPMGRGSKRREVGPELIHTPLWGPQIPVCPSFPLLRDQIPSLRSVWTCRAEPTVPRMLSRRHATLSGLLLNRLDFRTKAHRARLGTVHFDFYSFWKWILLQNWQLKILNVLLSLVFICEPACCGLCMSMRRYKS